jgi:hypothetical protein
VKAGRYYSSTEYSEGSTPYCSASAVNNGVSKKIDLPPDFNGHKIIIGKVGCKAFYQKDPFSATSDVNVLTARFCMSENVAMFIVAIINKSENYKWSYGRQCRVGDTKKINIKLPILIDEDLKPIIDESKKFSKKGYIPDFKFMEKYIKSLNYKPISTKNVKNYNRLFVDDWEEFYLHNIFNTFMGNGIDRVSTSNDNPKYNYISRDSNGNGVVDFVDEIEGVKAFPSGAMSLALGGSFLGSCFIQKEPFYTAQNVGVLQEKEPLSIYTKLFIATLIRNECKIKYQAFGRELNSHFRKDFTIKLPILKNNNKVVRDATKKYSEEGYIPDWKWMENYMKSLPYGDRIDI